MRNSRQFHATPAGIDELLAGDIDGVRRNARTSAP
jgi:hypothetical protein